MTQINWPSLPDAREAAKAGADMLIYTADGKERRTGYDGGWVQLTDGTHTSSNKLTVAADTLTHITIDGAGAGTETSFRRGIGADIFAGSTLRPSATGEVFQISLTMQISKATSNAIYAEVDVAIGETYATMVARDRRQLTKGSGAEDFLFFSGPLPVSADFARYGARFYLLTSEETQIWNKAIFIQRTHSP